MSASIAIFPVTYALQELPFQSDSFCTIQKVFIALQILDLKTATKTQLQGQIESYGMNQI